MTFWRIGLSLFLGLLLGCGLGCGGRTAVTPAPPPTDTLTEADQEVAEESLTEQLSHKRLEELLAKSGLPGIDPILEEELKKWDQVLKFDVPIAMNKQVRAYLVYFSTERKEVIRRYLARSTRYLPMIREIFQEHGLPEDLAYLAMIESGFNPHAYSHAHACGMWQFIKGTALRYGLVINNYVDERRDPEKSTHAAAKYLLDLYKQFGSWYLAAASYNCGEGRVQRELDQTNHRNFWELSGNERLPTETKNYVPQMIAATIIAKNPEKFGFHKIPYLPPLQYETVKVKEPTSLKAAAIACNVPPEELELLNPELRKGVTPPDLASYTLRIPKHSRELFEKNIQLARIEAPAQAYRVLGDSEPAARRIPATRTGNGAARGKETQAPPAKSRSKSVKAKKKVSGQTTLAKKGKSQGAQAAKGKEASVQEASILGAGRAAKSTSGSLTAKANGKESAKPAKSSATAGKNSSASKKPNTSAGKKNKKKVS
jgi:soluble lytic murein transglycosylase-like protein